MNDEHSPQVPFSLPRHAPRALPPATRVSQQAASSFPRVIDFLPASARPAAPSQQDPGGHAGIGDSEPTGGAAEVGTVLGGGPAPDQVRPRGADGTAEGRVDPSTAARLVAQVLGHEDAEFQAEMRRQLGAAPLQQAAPTPLNGDVRLGAGHGTGHGSGTGDVRHVDGRHARDHTGGDGFSYGSMLARVEASAPTHADGHVLAPYAPDHELELVAAHPAVREIAALTTRELAREALRARLLDEAAAQGRRRRSAYEVVFLMLAFAVMVLLTAPPLVEVLLAMHGTRS